MTTLQSTASVTTAIPNAPRKKRYAVCGVSGRGMGMFIAPMVGIRALPEYGDFSEHGEIAALLDIDAKRMAKANENLKRNFPTYPPDDFSRMVRETQPDVVVVCGPDHTHAQHTITALEHDLNVICEKPMVTDCRQAQAVIDAENRSKGKVRVTFNYRYTQQCMAVKRLLMSGAIGRVVNVEFIYNLDTRHGASYFRRWNRDRTRSGGLSIHKCCHHFDLINWFLDDDPEQVFAFGALNSYGADSPHNPSKRDGNNYTVKEQQERCPYHLRWNAGAMRPLKDDHLTIHEEHFTLPYDEYSKQKPLYIYDPEIKIEDTYSAVVRYKRGASMTYSCNFSTPWEGFILGINGTHGRIETRDFTAPDRCPFPVDERQTITVLPLFGERQVHEVRHVAGGHGGADPMLKYDLFVAPTRESSELKMVAGTHAGAMAVAIGEGVWRSSVEKRLINVAELFER